MDPTLLQGRWELRRRVLDRRSHERGFVQGELIVSSDGLGLLWREIGRFSWAGQVFDASRTTRLRPVGDSWWMEFEDGRPFHPWRPGTVVEHPCADDVYRGIVDVCPSRIRTWWDVTGPTKSQRLVTRFRRLG